MNSHKKVYILIFILFLLLLCFSIIPILAFSGSVIFDQMKTDYRCQSVRRHLEGAKQSIQVENNSPEFEFINELQSVYSSDDIYTDGTSAFIVGSRHKNEDVSLMSIDIKTGKSNWSLCETESMTFRENHLYVGYTDFGGAFVTAYDAKSGIKIWSTKAGSPVLSDIEITSIGLLVTTNDHGRKKYHLLDKNDGQQIRSFSDQHSLNEFFTQNGQSIIQLTEESVTSFGLHNWETKLTEIPYRATINTTLRKGIILVDIRDHFISQILALDSNTGAILWQTERNVKSDLAVEDDIVYFLTDESLLLASDIKTGNTLGYVVFSPSLKEMSEFDFVNSYPRVSVNDGAVVVYFDSARQLFAFGFSFN